VSPVLPQPANPTANKPAANSASQLRFLFIAIDTLLTRDIASPIESPDHTFNWAAN
jgi:hypothetical protein